MSNLISILIPNYNKVNFLKETLDSIVNQTYGYWECIIVDDHSTDNSWDLLNEFAVKDTRFKIIRRPIEIPKGGNFCRNYAFSLAKGEYINWFDSDDIMHPMFLETKIDAFKKNPSLDAAIVRFECFEHKISESYFIDYIPRYDNLVFDYFKGIQFQTGGPLFRKAFLDGKKLFNERLRFGQEKEFFYRLILSDMKVEIINKNLFFYRQAPDSIVANNDHIDNPMIKDLYLYFMLRSLVFSKHNQGFIRKYGHRKLLYLFKRFTSYMQLTYSFRTALLYLYSKFRLNRILSNS